MIIIITTESECATRAATLRVQQWSVVSGVVIIITTSSEFRLPLPHHRLPTLTCEAAHVQLEEGEARVLEQLDVAQD